jgi:hypothetical protein
MAEKKKQPHPVADQFSDDEMEQIKRYGQALSGPTDFSDEVEKELVKRGAYDRPRPQEASAAKMHAAQTGGSLGLGPTEAEQQSQSQQACTRLRQAGAAL